MQISKMKLLFRSFFLNDFRYKLSAIRQLSQTWNKFVENNFLISIPEVWESPLV